MECGTEYGMDYETHLVYHKHANYMAMSINYPLSVATKGEVIVIIIIHVYVHVSPQQWHKKFPIVEALVKLHAMQSQPWYCIISAHKVHSSLPTPLLHPQKCVNDDYRSHSCLFEYY